MATMVCHAFFPASRRVAGAGSVGAGGAVGDAGCAGIFGTGKSIVIFARFRDERASDGVTPLAFRDGPRSAWGGDAPRGRQSRRPTRRDDPVACSNGKKMTLKELRSRYRGQILALAEKRGAHNVRGFGSVVRGEQEGSSDMDFLVGFRSDARR
jgi:hypothetical protein